MQRVIVCSVIAVLLSTGRAVAQDATDDPSNASPPQDLTSIPRGGANPAETSRPKKSGKKGKALPRLDSQREKKEFERRLALAQELLAADRCGAAYPMYLDLQKQQPDDSYVLRGIGTCGAVTAEFAELGLEVRRQRLHDASAAFATYARLPATTPSDQAFAAFARRRASELAAKADALVPPAPSTVVAAAASDSQASAVGAAAPPLPATPAPSVVCDADRDAALLRALAQARLGDYRTAIAGLSALPPRCAEDLELVEHLLIWKAAILACDGVPMLYAPIMGRSMQPAVHEAVVVCAKHLNQPDLLLAAFERQVALVESPDLDALLVLADLHEAAGKRDRAQADIERFLEVTAQRPGMDAARKRASARLAALHAPPPSAKERAQCLIRRGVATARLVQLGDHWVMQVAIPPTAGGCAE